MLLRNILNEQVPNCSCQVLINVTLQIIRLHFVNFDLPYYPDKVRVYDGNNASAPVLRTFTRTSGPSDVHSTGNTVLVSFVTDGSKTRNGFKIVYSAITGKIQWCVGAVLKTLLTLVTHKEAYKTISSLY